MIELVQTNDPKIVQRLVQLEIEAFGAGGMNEWHLIPLIRHGRVYIMKKNEEIIGQIHYMRDWDNPGKAYIYGISVAKEWRGQGIGTRLLEESLKALAKENIQEVELTVDPQNAAAVRVYENKLGFSVIEYRTDEYGQGENRLVMRLPLV